MEGFRGLRVPRRGVARWTVWTLPVPVLAVLLVVELLAVGTLAASIPFAVDQLPDNWALFTAVLVGAGVLSTEASLGVERMRHQSDETPHIDLSSVWTFAAAALLPGAAASVVVLGIYGHLYARVWRGGVPPHRAIYSTATVVLAVQAASAVTGLVERDELFTSLPGLAAVLL